MTTGNKNGKSISLTEQCLNRLRKLILAGSLKNRGEFINEKTLREKLCVSRVTMRRSLALLQEENLLVSIPYKGYILGPAAYIHGKPGTDPSVKKDLILWAQSPDARPFRENIHDRLIYDAAEAEAEALGLRIEPCRLSLKELVKNVHTSLKDRLYGVALDWPDREIADALLLEGVPVVLVEYFYEGLSLDSIIQDDTGGIELAVDHLLKAGHKEIGLIAWSRIASQPIRRRTAFIGALLKNGLVEHGQIGLTARFDAQGGREAAAALFKSTNPPTALILSHLEMAAGVFEELQARGKVPCKDVAITAWGTPDTKSSWLANTPWANLPLDLITWSRPEMGRLIIRMLKARWKEPTLPPLRVELPTVLEPAV